MNCKESLKEYIDKDEIYQDYKQNKLMNPSDFDKFCIQHCKDIEELLEENLELEQALDKIEKYIKNHKRKSETRIYGLEIPEFIFYGDIEDIEKYDSSFFDPSAEEIDIELDIVNMLKNIDDEWSALIK